MTDADFRKNNSRITLIIVIVCVAVIAAVALMVIFKKPSGNGMPGGFPPRGAQMTNTVSVKTQVCKIETLHDYVNTNGEIETQSSIEVFPSISGKVVEVDVSLGSNVSKGDVLAYVDPSVPGSEYAKSAVTAPISGTITQSPLKTGTQVSASSTFTVIGDVKNLQITASVPERYVASLKPGLKANITLEAYPDEIFSATVTRVSPVVDTTSRTKEVILNFDRYDSRINAGMFAKVKLYTLNYSGYPVIPSDCIVEKNNRKYVYTVNDDGESVSQVEITVGDSVDNVIQVKEGLKEGDTVVIEGMRVLSDGARILDITNGKVKKTEEEKPAFPDEKGGRN